MPGLQIFNKQDYTYTPLFCEENIWHLCRSLELQGIDTEQLSVFFLSNDKKEIVLFNQQYIEPGLALIYDYHVILKFDPDNDVVQVFDFDTHLSFPVDWDTYQQATFPDPGTLPHDQRMMIREIPANEYLACLTSDRTHMAHLPQSEHPQYACIRATDPERSIDLKEYWQMSRRIKGKSRSYPYRYSIS